MCRRVGNIVTDVNNHRDTAMLECRRVGHIVTDVNNHRDTAMLECRPVCSIIQLWEIRSRFLSTPVRMSWSDMSPIPTDVLRSSV